MGSQDLTRSNRPSSWSAIATPTPHPARTAPSIARLQRSLRTPRSSGRLLRRSRDANRDRQRATGQRMGHDARPRARSCGRDRLHDLHPRRGRADRRKRRVHCLRQRRPSTPAARASLISRAGIPTRQFQPTILREWRSLTVSDTPDFGPVHGVGDTSGQLARDRVVRRSSGRARRRTSRTNASTRRLGTHMSVPASTRVGRIPNAAASGPASAWPAGIRQEREQQVDRDNAGEPVGSHLVATESSFDHNADSRFT